jgi:hypothetical protein
MCWLADELRISVDDAHSTLDLFAEIGLIDSVGWVEKIVYIPKMLELRDEWSRKRSAEQRRSKSTGTPEPLRSKSVAAPEQLATDLDLDSDLEKEKHRLHGAVTSHRSAQTATAGANDLVDEAKGIFERIPLSDGSEYPVHVKAVADWQREFPAVDVKQAIRGTRAWALARQPHERKARHEIRQSLRWYLSKQQDGDLTMEEGGF